ncbi:MAG: S-methyl-5-thioribose-1-phosphate isomerase [Nevskiales bacterium]
MTEQQQFSAIRWQGNSLALLDQRRLPGEEIWLQLDSAAAVAQAITDMVVRGAPAIGIAAAYGLVLDAQAGRDMQLAQAVLAASRPTAVNLHWALQRMQPLRSDPAALQAEAVAIHAEDLQQNQRMGELGADLLAGPVSLLTHCNTGALATGGYGTALGVIRSAHQRRLLKEVFAGETRPWLQGARLTAWELLREGIQAQLIADSTAASLMRVGRIDWVIVGADRIAANGDVANKIGTYSLAVLARQHGLRFMVVAATGTIDMQCPSGDAIPIEQRDQGELLSAAPAGAQAYNPVFDITPANYVDFLVTERGVVAAPDAAKMQALMLE